MASIQGEAGSAPEIHSPVKEQVQVVGDSIRAQIEGRGHYGGGKNYVK